MMRFLPLDDLLEVEDHPQPCNLIIGREVQVQIDGFITKEEELMSQTDLITLIQEGIEVLLVTKRSATLKIQQTLQICHWTQHPP